MDCLFDPNIFDPDIFDTCAEVTPAGGGWPMQFPAFVPKLEYEDDEEFILMLMGTLIND